MKNKRILSILLSFTIIFSYGFSTGVLAEEEPVINTESFIAESAAVSVVDEGYVEETVIPDEESYAVDDTSYYEEEIVYEEGAEDIAYDEQSYTEPEVIENVKYTEDTAPVEYVDETTDNAESSSSVTEPIVEEYVDEYAETYSEAVEEIPAVEEPAEFTEGYVRIKKDTVVYKAESTQEEAGTFTEDSIVYAVVTTPGSVTDDSWMWIVFDTEEAKAAAADVPSAYVQYKDAEVLTDKDVDELIFKLAGDPTTRNYQEKFLQVVSFATAIVPDLTETEAVSSETSLPETVSDTAYAAGTSPVTITQEPSDVKNAEVGSKYTFSVAASGSIASYRWKISTDGGTTWKNTGAKGYNTPTLTITVSDNYNGYMYYCVITDTAGNVYNSASATVYLAKDSINITEEPEDIINAEIGQKYYLHVGAEGDGLTYQWKISTDGGASFTNTGAAGNKTSRLTVNVISAAYEGRQYYCVITDASGNTLDSNVATVHLKGDPIIITEQPGDIDNAEIGQKYYLHVGAEGDGLTYQWKISTDGGETFKNTSAVGNKTATITVNVVSNAYEGRQYYCVITDASGNALDSDIATIHLSLTDGSFTYELNEAGDGIVVTKYLLNEESVTVPDQFNNIPVTEIGVEAFMDKTSIVSIDLPDSITVIRARAFKNCTNLRDMH